MRNGKLFFSLSISAVLLLCSAMGVSAKSIDDSSGALEKKENVVYELKLEGLTVETPYNPSLYDFVREEIDSGVNVTVAPYATTVPTGSTNKFPCNKMTTTGTVMFKTSTSSSAGVNLNFFGFTLGADNINRYAVNAAGYSITFGI